MKKNKKKQKKKLKTNGLIYHKNRKLTPEEEFHNYEFMKRIKELGQSNKKYYLVPSGRCCLKCNNDCNNCLL